jgi:hypothetical protein
MVIHEDRPEVTNRRDDTTPAAWLRGKRVLVLGCGALGAPIAEHCVRAGVAALTVADNSVVKPGILIRQPYRDSDIDYFKAQRLAGRLSSVRRDLTVESLTSNVIGMFVGEHAKVPDYHLVIDATADIGVRAAIETARATARDDWPPVITGLFGHDAMRALSIVSRPGATGSAHDILRRIAIDAHATGGGLLGDIAEDFFPDPPRTKMFFPEPGCSSPTFTGSSIQTAALAASVFWTAISELADPESEDPMVAVAIALPSASRTGAGGIGGAGPTITCSPTVATRCASRRPWLPRCGLRRAVGHAPGVSGSRPAGCCWGLSMRRLAASTSTPRRARRPTVRCRRCSSRTEPRAPRNWLSTTACVRSIVLGSWACGTPTRTVRRGPAAPTKLGWGGSCPRREPVGAR